VVVECLAPCDEGEAGEGLGLEFECEVEVLEAVSGCLECMEGDKAYLDDCVDTEGDTTCSD
jgi:hypothetical protein